MTEPDPRDPKMRRVYIAGPISGMPDLNFPAFNAAASRLLHLGFVVENPVANWDAPDPTSRSWLDWMRMDLVRMSRVDWLFMLPGWQRSRGATIEHRLASDLGLPIVYAEGAEP